MLNCFRPVIVKEKHHTVWNNVISENSSNVRVGTAVIRKAIFAVMLLSPVAAFVFVGFLFFFRSEFVVGIPSDLFSLSRPRPSNLFPACRFPSLCASFCPPRPLFSLALRGTLDISCVGADFGTVTSTVYNHTSLFGVTRPSGLHHDCLVGDNKVQLIYYPKIPLLFIPPPVSDVI